MSSRKKAGVLAECLLLWRNGEDGAESAVAALRVAEFVNLVTDALTRKK